MKRTVQNKRKLASGAPNDPNNLMNLLIPDNYRITSNEEKFLYYDSGLEEERILIFTTNKEVCFFAIGFWVNWQPGNFDTK
jgi:hypothetical protein